MDLYAENILDHYQNPRQYGRIEEPTASAHELNPSCGDMLVVDIVVEDGKITAIGFAGKGCAVSIAAASMLFEKITGMELDVAQRLAPDKVYTLLGGQPSTGRIKCALLGLSALKKALEQL